MTRPAPCRPRKDHRMNQNFTLVRPAVSSFREDRAMHPPDMRTKDKLPVWPMATLLVNLTASVIEAMACPLVYGHDAAQAAAWAIRNRFHPPINDRPLGHYFAGLPETMPSETCIRIARQAWSKPEKWDPVDGRTLILTGEDVIGFFEPIGRTQERLDAIRFIGCAGLELWIARFYPSPIQ